MMRRQLLIDRDEVSEKLSEPHVRLTKTKRPDKIQELRIGKTMPQRQAADILSFPRRHLDRNAILRPASSVPLIYLNILPPPP